MEGRSGVGLGLALARDLARSRRNAFGDCLPDLTVCEESGKQ